MIGVFVLFFLCDVGLSLFDWCCGVLFLSDGRVGVNMYCGVCWCFFFFVFLFFLFGGLCCGVFAGSLVCFWFLVVDLWLVWRLVLDFRWMFGLSCGLGWYWCLVVFYCFCCFFVLFWLFFCFVLGLLGGLVVGLFFFGFVLVVCCVGFFVGDCSGLWFLWGWFFLLVFFCVLFFWAFCLVVFVFFGLY